MKNQMEGGMRGGMESQGDHDEMIHKKMGLDITVIEIPTDIKPGTIRGVGSEGEDMKTRMRIVSDDDGIIPVNALTSRDTGVGEMTGTRTGKESQEKEVGADLHGRMTTKRFCHLIKIETTTNVSIIQT